MYYRGFCMHIQVINFWLVSDHKYSMHAQVTCMSLLMCSHLSDFSPHEMHDIKCWFLCQYLSWSIYIASCGDMPENLFWMPHICCQVKFLSVFDTIEIQLLVLWSTNRVYNNVQTMISFNLLGLNGIWFLNHDQHKLVLLFP